MRKEEESKNAYIKGVSSLILGLSLIVNSQTSELPNFLDKKNILNADFKCLDSSSKYTKDEQKHINVLWDETLSYLNAYAQACIYPYIYFKASL